MAGKREKFDDDSRKSNPDKYFRKVPSINCRSLPEVLELLAVAHSKVKNRTNLYFPDQNFQTQETFVNLLIVWAADMIERGGVREFERHMAAPFEKLHELVVKHMETRLDEGDEDEPEITHPRKPKPKPKK